MTYLICIQRRRIGGLWLAIALAAISGCGRTANVTGKITYQGRDVRYGSVVFLGVDKTARSGVIGSDGSYALENAPLGTVTIGVISHNPSKGRSVVRGGKPAGPGKKEDAPALMAEGWFPLPQKFERPKSSGLTCTVIAGHFHHDIELK